MTYAIGRDFCPSCAADRLCINQFQAGLTVCIPSVWCFTMSTTYGNIRSHGRPPPPHPGGAQHPDARAASSMRPSIASPGSATREPRLPKSPSARMSRAARSCIIIRARKTSSSHRWSMSFGLRLEDFGQAFAQVPAETDRRPIAVDLMWSMFQGRVFHAWLELVVASRTDEALREALQGNERALSERPESLLQGNLRTLAAD